MFKKKGAVSFSNAKKPIVTIDPYTNSSYIFKNNKFEKAIAKSLEKDNYVVSYIQSKDVLSGIVYIARNIPEEDLKDAIEIKAYEELGLDSGLEYEIYYFESNSQHDDERAFHVFALDKDVLYDIYSQVKHIKYIDYITVAPFLFKSLYTKGILELSKTDCFIYFHKDDAFVSIYQNGEFIFLKSIRYTLSVILDTFSKEIGKRVDENEFYKMLSDNGLQNKDALYQKEIMKLFGEVFVYINDVIAYAKRAYSLKNIDNIFLGSEIGVIAGMDEFCHSYVNIPTSQLEVKIAKNVDDLRVNVIHSLMVLEAQTFRESGEEGLNLSIFRKPPPFKHSPSGKLVAAIAAGLFFSLLKPAYEYVEDTMFLQQDLKKLNIKYNELHTKSISRKEAFAVLDTEHKKIDKRLDKKSSELDFRTKLLYEIYSKKVSYPMKAKILTTLFDKVVKHESKVVLVDNNASDMIIKVRSSKDKLMTELLADLANYREYDVSAKSIKKDENGSYYESSIKVGLDVR